MEMHMLKIFKKKNMEPKEESLKLYLHARDLENQILARKIAQEYGIDYDLPVIRNIVNEILIEKGLLSKEQIESRF